MSKCKCDAGFTALGLPDCQLTPSIPVRLYFTTDPEPFVKNLALLLYGITPYAYQNNISTLPANYDYHRDTYKLASPFIHEVGGERADAITEEVGGTPFFVRNGDRTIQATFVGKQAELIKFVEELRCASQLGVYIVDDNGVVWGQRIWGGLGEWAKAIPVTPSTIQAKMDLPSASTVQKVRVGFTLGRTFSDGDFVPVATAEIYSQLGLPDPREYNAPRHVAGKYFVVGGNVVLIVFSEFGNGSSFLPIRPVQLPDLTLTAYSATGSVLGTITFTAFTLPNGLPAYQYTGALPTGTAYLAYTQAQVSSIAYNGFDWLSFRATP